MHLVNWNVVRAPKSHGSLGILDPILSNLELRENILWGFVLGNQEQWKKVITHKYLVGDKLRCLDSLPVHTIGSPMWKLLKA